MRSGPSSRSGSGPGSAYGGFGAHTNENDGENADGSEEADEEEEEEALSQLTAEREEEVRRKIAGFVCRAVLADHVGIVSSFCVVPPQAHGRGRTGGAGEQQTEASTTYLVSGGWDGRLVIWNLDTCTLVDSFRNPEASRDRRELACDGVILDMCYCSRRHEFAYASSGKQSLFDSCLCSKFNSSNLFSRHWQILFNIPVQKNAVYAALNFHVHLVLRNAALHC